MSQANEAGVLPNVKVTQGEVKRLIAIVAHLTQIIRTVSDDGSIRIPTNMDHAELILASASLRALFLDYTPRPLLSGFLEDHSLKIEIDAVETNLGLVLLSKHTQDGHVADLIGGSLLGVEGFPELPLDKEVDLFAFHEDWSGMEGLKEKPDLWVPNKEQGEKIGSYLTHASNVGPSQMLKLCRRRVLVNDWGKVRIGHLKHIGISRRSIISHVANQLGGVHYESPKKPSKVKDPGDYLQYETLSKSYDWNDKTLMHAGLVAVALSCLEVVATPQIIKLCSDLKFAYHNRQKGLEAKLYENPEGSSN